MSLMCAPNELDPAWTFSPAASRRQAPLSAFASHLPEESWTCRYSSFGTATSNFRKRGGGEAENRSGIARRFPESINRADEAPHKRRPEAGGSKTHRGSGWIST